VGQEKRWCFGAGLGLVDPDHSCSPNRCIYVGFVRSLVLFLTSAQGLRNPTRSLGSGGNGKVACQCWRTLL
jgi:hypothetical protein